jgi:hypothetical protein
VSKVSFARRRVFAFRAALLGPSREELDKAQEHVAKRVIARRC